MKQKCQALLFHLWIEWSSKMVITRKRGEEALSSPQLINIWERFGGVVVIGGANIDIKGKSFKELLEMTSNPGKVSMALGGVGRNIAHNLALLRIPVNFLGVVGDDEWGRKILRETGEAGVDMEKVKVSRKNTTGVYLAILDEKGEMEVAVSDMKACEEINVRYIKSKEEVIRESKMVVMDTNLPEKSIKFVTKMCSEEGIKLLVDPVSVEKSKKLKKVLNKIDYITPNLRELESLTGRVKINSDEDMKRAVEKLRNKSKGVKNIVLTLAGRGIFLCGEELETERMRESRKGSKDKFIPPYKAEAVELTGVGDALVAGFVYGVVKGMPIKIAAKYGLAAAALTISTPHTVNPNMREGILKVVVEREYE